MRLFTSAPTMSHTLTDPAASDQGNKVPRGLRVRPRLATGVTQWVTMRHKVVWRRNHAAIPDWGTSRVEEHIPVLRRGSGPLPAGPARRLRHRPAGRIAVAGRHHRGRGLHAHRGRPGRARGDPGLPRALRLVRQPHRARVRGRRPGRLRRDAHQRRRPCAERCGAERLDVPDRPNASSTGTPVIFDLAPVAHGVASDVAYSCTFGHQRRLRRARRGPRPDPHYHAWRGSAPASRC